MHRHALSALLVLSLLSSGLAQTSAPSPQRNRRATPPPPTTSVKEDADDVVRITTNLVQIDVAVSKDGKPVANLQKEDFDIFEDGKRQEITSFAYISTVPTNSNPRTKAENWLKDKNAPPTVGGRLRPEDTRRTIALVVDDLGLSAESMPRVISQIRKFVTEQLDPNDLVAIIRTGGQMGALQQFTNDRRMIQRSLDQLRWNMCSRVGFSILPPLLPNVFPGAGPPLGSRFYSAPCALNAGSTMNSLSFIADAMGALPGRKSMVVFSESMPVEDQEFDFDHYAGRAGGVRGAGWGNYYSLLNRIAEKAIRSSIVIYAVDTSGLMYTGLTAADSGFSAASSGYDMNQIMNARSNLLLHRREGADLIAKQTGGFLVRNSNDFRLKRILEEQSGYYLIGYRPADETFDGRFHKIKAKLKKSGMTLRTRFGFYGITEEEANRVKQRPDRDRTTLALMSPFGAQDIEIDLTSFFVQGNSGPMIRSFLYLNARDLTFAVMPDGSHEANVELRGVFFGNNGAMTGDQTAHKKLILTAPQYETAKREGVYFQFDTQVKTPGAFQFRISARDLASSRIGASGQYIEVPNLKNKQLALSGIVMRSSPTGGQTNQLSTASDNAAHRRFAPGADLTFLSLAYNALLDPLNHRPDLIMQARLFHNDKVFYTSPEISVDTTNQTDLTQVVVAGNVHLASDLEPGNYYLQLVLFDRLSAVKQPRMAIQWLDFDVVK
jgi:VWFA-related protein